MNGHPRHLIDGLWCATLTPLDGERRASTTRALPPTCTAVRPGRRGHRAVRHDRRRPVVLGRRAPRRARRAARGGVPGGAHRCRAPDARRCPRRSRSRRHATSARLRRVRSCCRRSSGRSPSDEGLFAWYARLIEARRRSALAHLPVSPAAGLRGAAVGRPGRAPRRGVSRRRSPASRTARATGKTPPRCSSGRRS